MTSPAQIVCMHVPDHDQGVCGVQCCSAHDGLGFSPRLLASMRAAPISAVISSRSSALAPSAPRSSSSPSGPGKSKRNSNCSGKAACCMKPCPMRVSIDLGLAFFSLGGHSCSSSTWLGLGLRLGVEFAEPSKPPASQHPNATPNETLFDAPGGCTGRGTPRRRATCPAPPRRVPRGSGYTS